LLFPSTLRPPLALSISPQKRTKRKPSEPHSKTPIQQQVGMFRSGPPGTSRPISALHKEQREQGEKQTGDFQPQHAAGMRKRRPQPLAKGLHPPFDRRDPVSHLPVRRDGYTRRDRAGMRGSPFHPITEHIRSHADANAERAAYSPWLHCKSLSARGFRLLRCNITSKVGKTAPAAGEWENFFEPTTSSPYSATWGSHP